MSRCPMCRLLLDVEDVAVFRRAEGFYWPPGRNTDKNICVSRWCPRERAQATKPWASTRERRQRSTRPGHNVSYAHVRHDPTNSRLPSI